MPRGCPAGSTRIAPTPVGGARGGPNTPTARRRGLRLPPRPRLLRLLLLGLLLLGLLLLGLLVRLSPPPAATRAAGAPLLVLKTLEGEILERHAALVELLPAALASQIAGACPKEHVVLLLLSRGKGAPGDVYKPVGFRAPKLGGEDHVRIEDLLQALPDSDDSDDSYASGADSPRD